LEHGKEQSNDSDGFPEIRMIEPRLLAPYYVQSGWPVALAPVAAEAWRRYEADTLKEEEFYCSEAVVAGMCKRSLEIADEVRAQRDGQSG
jgi:DNA (cytosine-5)-methyltransferase 1